MYMGADKMRLAGRSRSTSSTPRHRTLLYTAVENAFDVRKSVNNQKKNPANDGRR